MITILNSKFEKQVNVAADAEFIGCEFAAQGSSIKDKVFGVEVTGDAKLTIKDSKFANRGYSAVHMASSGDILLESNSFDCSSVYNPVEGAVSTGETNNVSLISNSFSGKCGNNYVNFYRMLDGAHIVMNGNKYDGVSVDSEILRISNPLNANAVFDIKGEAYNFLPGEPTEYTAFIMCQDYTAKTGNPQNFTKIAIDMENVLCNGKKVNAEGAAVGGLFFVYEDGRGIITGENDPVIIVK